MTSSSTGRQPEDGIYPSEGERERALRYSRTREWLVLAGMVWSALESGAVLTSGLSARLRRWATRAAPTRIGPVMPYVAAFSALSFLASLPLSYFGGYVVEHRFGLSNQTRRAWLLDQLKGLGVGIALGAPLAQGAYWARARPSSGSGA